MDIEIVRGVQGSDGTRLINMKDTSPSAPVDSFFYKHEFNEKF